ncbi:MAG: SRPBCC domain-containing protein [Phycisphaeraceae bacterium]|nr:SRPBCC domain-containing protein [Phycisphaeraceae bacterium]
MNTAASVNELTLTKLIPAPPEQAFDAWVVPGVRMKWWAAQQGMFCDLCEIDAQVGGRYRINMKTPDRGHEYIVAGEFTIFDRPRRLAFTWSWEPGSEDPNEPGSSTTDTTVSIQFEPADGGTLIRLHHTGFNDAPQRDNHLEGWTGCLDKLAELR